MPQDEVAQPISYSMAPYSGAWTKAEAGHLLRRTMFGPTNQQILTAETDGMATTVNNLLQVPVIGEPIAHDPQEIIAGFGTSWVNSVYPSDPLLVNSVAEARNKSLAAWIIGRLNTESVSIAEKMTLFWQNHFAAPFTGDPRATYDYHALIYNNSLGNFKQLVKDVTINPCMLLFLNGATNTLFSPNENYARELLELFTIGKGPQIGSGDYTYYKEEDIAAGAKILTGYIVDGLASDTLTNVTASFNATLHDSSTKILSSHFGGVSIPDNGANEYSDYIDIIFQQNEVANHICRKLYRYFVNFDLTTSVESDIIPVMAATMISNNYEVIPVIAELLSSEHFYDLSLRGTLIKGPLDMLLSVFNSTESVPGFDILTDGIMYSTLYSYGDVLGQSYASPPSVAGWPAYYQEPAYSQLWINATHLRLRFQLTDFVTLYTGIPGNGNNWKLNILTFLDNLSSPADAIAVIDDLVDVFVPKGMDAVQKLILKTILTNGQPDFEWTIEYGAYTADPGNSNVSDPVRSRVEAVLARLFQMPEFHTL